jgi:hypothetical protein
MRESGGRPEEVGAEVASAASPRFQGARSEDARRSERKERKIVIRLDVRCQSALFVLMMVASSALAAGAIESKPVRFAK